MNEHEYNVIQFLEVPYKEIADYVCVPGSWVQTRGPVDPKVKVAYPVEDPLATEKKVKKRHKKSDQWKSYLSVVKYRTDSFGDANRYIQELLKNEGIDEKLRRSSRKPTSSAKMNTMEALRLIPIPENDLKSVNPTPSKRKAQSGSDKEAFNKRSKVTEPNEIDDEVTEPSNRKCELISDNQSLTQAMSVEDLCTQKGSVDKVKEKEIQHRYSTEDKTTVYEDSKTNHSLDSERIVIQDNFDEFCRDELQALQTNLQVYTTSLFTQAIKKITSNVSACSSRFSNTTTYISKNLPQDVPKLSENERNDIQTQEKDHEYDDDDQPLKRISSQKRIKKIDLSPESDENDSRWTLKHRGPAPGLVELMEHSGVYVNADKLTECKKLANNCQTLARMLLFEIFTTKALSVCVLGNGFGVDEEHDGPDLDTRATVTLLKFVADYGLVQGWEVNDYRCILNGIRNNIAIMRTIGTQEEKQLKKRGGHGKSTTIAKHSHKRRFDFPPEYDKNDSRWTLKYRGPAPGLVELMKHSGVYVNALRLANCKRLSKDSKTLARMLLTEIFSTSGLSTCSWTGARAKAFDQDGMYVRPGLDEHARTVLLNYVADRAKKEGWNSCEHITIVNSMRNKIQEMRFKYKS